MIPARYRITLIALVVAAVVFRFVWEINTPLKLLWQFEVDDALFVRLAQQLLSGHWLGRYSLFTLMKGPGYPLFLAIGGASGFSVSVLHAAFAIISVGVATWAAARLTGSLKFAAATFVLLLFLPLPISFDPDQHRILRDQIYWGQSLIVFSLFAVLLFQPPRRASACLALAAAGGLVLGWTWNTREEGEWLIPGIAFLFCAKGFQSWSAERVMGRFAVSTGVAAAGFALVLLMFMTTNLFVYGRFAGTESKESNFQAALTALQSIDDPNRIPRVPVSNATLKLAAEASPAFRPIADALGPEPQRRIPARYCELARCDVVPGAYFMWMFRAAAAASGFYSSPNTASRKFAEVAAELRAACENGGLKCHSSLVGIVPPMEAEQWYHLPRTIVRAISVISLWDQRRFDMPTGAEISDKFEGMWRFLNYPRVIGPPSKNTTLSGWFRDSKLSAPPKLQVQGPDGVSYDAVPLGARGKDADANPNEDSPKAERNKFRIVHECSADCTLVASFSDGNTMRLKVPAGGGSAKLSQDGMTLRIVSNVAEASALFGPDPRSFAALNISNAILSVYRIVFPLLLAVGALCWAAASARSVRARQATPLLIVATAAWTMVFFRSVLIALVDVSSFDAVNALYLAPAIPLAGLAAVFSISALARHPRLQTTAKKDQVALEPQQAD